MGQEKTLKLIKVGPMSFRESRVSHSSKQLNCINFLNHFCENQV